MRRFGWKKVCALVLASAMLLTTAACGKGSGNGAGGKQGAKDQTANIQAAKEGVFHYEEFPLETGKDQQLEIFANRAAENGYEMLASIHDYDNADEAYFCFCQKDGSGFEAKKLEKVSLEKLEGEPDNVQEASVSFRRAAITENRVFLQLEREIGRLVEENWEYETAEYLCCFDKEGSFLWKTVIDEGLWQTQESYANINLLAGAEGDKVYLILSGDVAGSVLYGENGAEKVQLNASGKQGHFENVSEIRQCADGTVLCYYYNDDWSKVCSAIYDPVKNSFRDEFEWPAEAVHYGITSFAPGADQKMFYSNSNGVFTFQKGDGAVRKLMNFVNSDLDSSYLQLLISMDDDHFIATYEDASDYKTHLCLFSYVKPKDVKEKKTLVYGCVSLDFDERSRIIDFNKKSNDYRIIVKDYGENDENGECYTRLNNDIIAGNVPDILQINSYMPMESFIEKGLFANVDELIKKDPELSKEVFMDNVFDAYRVNGVLYRVIPRFCIRTFIGRKSLLGDKNGLTMEEARQIAQTKLSGKQEIFGGGQTRDHFMESMMTYCGSDFVDISTGKCDFDNQLFVDFLEYAKTLPENDQESGSDDEYWEEYIENYYTQYRQNRTLLLECYISDFNSIKYQVKGLLGDEAAYVGFPTLNGTGSFVELEKSYAIAARSANLDGAWEYLRFYLCEDYQRNEDRKYGYLYGLPVLQKMILDDAQALRENPYWVDENGNKEYYEDSYSLGDETVTIDPFTEEELQKFIDFLSSVKKPEFYDENVINIVREEAGAFFSGAKSAKNVAEMIQNRVQLYVNENH